MPKLIRDGTAADGDSIRASTDVAAAKLTEQARAIGPGRCTPDETSPREFCITCVRMDSRRCENACPGPSRHRRRNVKLEDMSKLAPLAPGDACDPNGDRAKAVTLTRPSGSTLLAGAAALTVLLWSYVPILDWLTSNWSRNPDYSHGYLVPLFSLMLVWMRRDVWLADRSDRSNGSFAVGAGLILLGGATRAAGIYIQVITLEALSLLPCVAGIVLCCGGRAGWRCAWPAVAFLIFMIPIPGGLSGILSGQLQQIATVASTFVLQLIGLPAVAEGNIIWLSESRIGIAEACSGLRMLVSFAALATGVCLVIRRPVWEKIVVLASIPLVAIFANIIRVTATGIAYEFGSAELADRIFHDLAGWLMMPLGLGLLLAELAILSRIVLPAEDKQMVLRTQASGRSSRGGSTVPVGTKVAGIRKRRATARERIRQEG